MNLSSNQKRSTTNRNHPCNKPSILNNPVVQTKITTTPMKTYEQLNLVIYKNLKNWKNRNSLLLNKRKDKDLIKRESPPRDQLLREEQPLNALTRKALGNQINLIPNKSPCTAIKGRRSLQSFHIRSITRSLVVRRRGGIRSLVEV